ncbi:MAG: MBL fold metallo-hydrolase [Anaerolineales bacterium]|nr:MBL fold metallo-hydrolase [Anaerolineales bacterium]
MKNYQNAVFWISTVCILWGAAALALIFVLLAFLPPIVAAVLFGLASIVSLTLILSTTSSLNPARKAAAVLNRKKIASSQLSLKPISRLRLLPLVEYYTVDPVLSSSFAVSYYLETDEDRILFDLGIKLWEEDEAVLYRNARTLNAQGKFSLEKVDCIVNSHAHNDHLAARPDETILSEPDNPLQGKPFYAVEKLDVRGGGLKLIEQPALISPTAGSTGPLISVLFIAGPVREQSLVFHLAGRGLVLIIGCGHPGVRLIIEASEQIFGEKVWGIIGGLHYPVTTDRTHMGRFFHPQQLIGGPQSYPWFPISKRQVKQDIYYLQHKGIQYLAISAHDSCDWTLQHFKDSKIPSQVVKIGEEIVL